jgi:hypothetical protein
LGQVSTQVCASSSPKLPKQTETHATVSLSAK